VSVNPYKEKKGFLEEVALSVGEKGVIASAQSIFEV